MIPPARPMRPAPLMQLFILVMLMAMAQGASASGVQSLASAKVRESGLSGGNVPGAESPSAASVQPAALRSVVGGASVAVATAGTGLAVPPPAPSQDAKAAPVPAAPLERGPTGIAPEPTEPGADAGWEERFSLGLKLSIQASEAVALGSWAFDSSGSAAAVPALMLRAEELLLAAIEDAPVERRREKTAERALRVYNHGKWLAERNYARAAEWRYREAFRLALESRRHVLAAHSLSRLGYFLMHWRRTGEAREVLRESEKLSKRSNPLAPYLYGVLERQVAGADMARLEAAEARILNSGEQPSEDLEAERQKLLGEIEYWHAAEVSPRKCMEADDAAHVVICLSVHAASALRRALVR
mmetsp:Transcript_6290/g.14369  ORF Transcript_6290/g.14369 Transcript_6290/m.14369 type:complete len:358 (-) Transcript_6290:89-1162(-)